MLKRFFLILLLVFSVQQVLLAQTDTVRVNVGDGDYAGDTTVVTTAVEDEEEATTVQEEINPKDTIPNTAVISTDTIAAWRAKKEFAYMAYLDSSLREYQKSLDKPKRSYEPGFLELILSSQIFSIIMWVIVAFVVGFILYRIFGLNAGIFKKKEKELSPEVLLTEDEQFLAQNFDDLAMQAYQQQDYRAAVRYHFLQLLKKMDERKRITFAIDKTNSSYIRELKDNKAEFASLVRHFEYVWFGKAPINNPQYLDIKSQFNSFKV